MQYKEYYQSALRHLDVCKTMMESLESMNGKGRNDKIKQNLKLDIYYLSGYIIETMISYTFFVNINWRRNEHIESCQLYDKGFKTHNLSAKLAFATSKAKCNYTGVSLLSNKITDKTEQKMFNEWSEVVRYRNPKACSNLEFTEVDLKKYIDDIESMFNQLIKKFYS